VGFIPVLTTPNRILCYSAPECEERGKAVSVFKSAANEAIELPVRVESRLSQVK